MPERIPITEWSVHDVSRWLESLELSEHKASFLQSSIDGSLLLALAAGDLVELGVTNKFHARKIISRRDKLAEEAQSGSGAPLANGTVRPVPTFLPLESSPTLDILVKYSVTRIALAFYDAQAESNGNHADADSQIRNGVSGAPEASTSSPLVGGAHDPAGSAAGASDLGGRGTQAAPTSPFSVPGGASSPFSRHFAAALSQLELLLLSPGPADPSARSLCPRPQEIRGQVALVTASALRGAQSIVGPQAQSIWVAARRRRRLRCRPFSQL